MHAMGRGSMVVFIMLTCYVNYFISFGKQSDFKEVTSKSCFSSRVFLHHTFLVFDTHLGHFSSLSVAVYLIVYTSVGVLSKSSVSKSYLSDV